MTTTNTPQREMDAWYRSFLERTRRRLAYNRDEALPKRERVLIEYQAEVDRCQAELDAARDAYRAAVSMDNFYKPQGEWTTEQKRAQWRLHTASFAMRLPQERLAHIIELRDTAIRQIADDEQILAQ
jgi:hypothetical protein